eukprot:CAMPEP_0197432202 /NCGR_PEP_ID=MMETSP1175-20131217/301_1 /TAXON_ID=1003142 /ORGANISM="Triceratium dubium, Strain CCMP147" /LENGTH=65 /DNA_ID=CAMNT_0042960215 /DNA_START=48 /DNA_END=242 /DNA_ORIENTATION=-
MAREGVRDKAEGDGKAGRPPKDVIRRLIVPFSALLLRLRQLLCYVPLRYGRKYHSQHYRDGSERP